MSKPPFIVLGRPKDSPIQSKRSWETIVPKINIVLINTFSFTYCPEFRKGNHLNLDIGVAHLH